MLPLSVRHSNLGYQQHTCIVTPDIEYIMQATSVPVWTLCATWIHQHSSIVYDLSVTSTFSGNDLFHFPPFTGCNLIYHLFWSTTFAKKAHLVFMCTLNSFSCTERYSRYFSCTVFLERRVCWMPLVWETLFRLISQSANHGSSVKDHRAILCMESKTFACLPCHLQQGKMIV